MAGRPLEFDRNEALDKAMQLFWRQGYDGTSMSDLTAELGVGRQSLYGAFGDKRTLFVACLERYTEEIFEKSLLSLLEGDGPPLAGIERVLDAWEAYVGSDQFVGCLLGKALAELGMHDAKLDALLRKKLDRIRGSLERALTRAQEAGELDATADARALARSITAFAQGAAVVCQVWREPVAVRETLAGARSLIDAHRTPPRRRTRK
jgi:TetR/AcrR family transcriptional regulator, transcriptional repressor for nem operon